MRAVNLLPRDLQQTRPEGGRAPVFVAGGGIAAVTAATVVLFVSATGSVADQRAQLDSVEAAIARISTRQTPGVAPGAIAQERAERTAALSAALATRAPVDRLLQEIAYVLPEDAWLTGLSTAVPAPTTAPGGAAAPSTLASIDGVTITGVTYSHTSVARVLARLAALPTLLDVRLSTSARVVIGGTATSEGSKRSVVTFAITARLRPGGPA